MDGIDLDIYKVYNDMDILDLMLLQDTVWNYIVSTPQFELYLQAMIEEEGLDWSIEEAKRYIEDDGWDVVRDFVSEHKGIQEDLNKNLAIDFDKLTFKLSKESS